MRASTHPQSCAQHPGQPCSSAAMYEEPGAEESEANRKEDYWEARGLDRLSKFLLFVLFPVLLVLLLGVLWRVSP